MEWQEYWTLYAQIGLALPVVAITFRTLMKPFFTETALRKKKRKKQSSGSTKIYTSPEEDIYG